MPCAACGSTLPPEAKFCPNCGAKVAGPDEAAASRATAASVALVAGPIAAAPIAAAPVAAAPAPAAPRHERRLLTVMFGDLVGFTSASDGADPEDVRARVRPFHDLVRREVARTGGTVARVVGDGVMVVWGYPTAREDDALRAVRAAIAIRQGIAALGNDMHVRLGINSGEAVVAFGSDDERADDAMGDAVNVAARLASGAPIDEIVVGEATATLAGSALRSEALAPLTLKGKAEPVPAFLVLGLADVRDVAGSTPFVGRSAELDALRDACRSAEVEHGAVRVLLTGEPGIGKSRLIAELRRERLAHGGPLWLVGRCRADAGAPGWALGEIVKTMAGIADDEAPSVAMAKVEAMVPSGMPERTWVRDRLAQLAGAMGGAAPSADELGLVWAAFLDAVAADRSVVVHIEDVHWADPELLDVLTGAGLGSVRTPLVLLFTARPEVLEARPDLALSCRLHVALTALAADDSDALISNLAEGLTLAPADRLRIVARSGGNPLFAGELMRLLAQGRTVRSGSTQTLLPETVQAVIAARLDLLSPETRAVARDAAVVGSNFWRGSVEALAAIEGRSADSLLAAIEELVRLDFIRPRRDSTLPGDPEYAFRHALVRDVAYGQLTRRDRAIRHAAAARWLAERAGPDRDDLAGIVADHDLRALELSGAAGDAIETGAVRAHAQRYLMRAGAFASGIDMRAAVERYHAAVEVAPDDESRLDALAQLAAAEVSAGLYADAIATAEIGLPVADDLHMPHARAALLLSRGHAQRPRGDATWADDIRQAIELLEQGPPTAALADAYALQTLVEMTEGSGTELLAWADKAVAVADHLGIPPPAGAIGRRGFARAMLGDTDGEDDLRRAIDLARASGDSVGLANAVSDLGGAYAYRGDPTQVEMCVRESIEIARTRGLRGAEAMGVFNLAHIMRVQGRFDEALETLERAREVAIAGQDRVRPYAITCERALAFDSRGDDDAADALVDAVAGRVPGPGWDGSLAVLQVLRAARRRDAATVRAAFARVYLQTVEGDLDAAEATTYLPLARAVISIGALDLAETILPTISRRSRIGAAIHDTLEGLIRAAEGSNEDARLRLARAILFWDAAGFRPEAAYGRQALAGAVEALGRHDEAVELLRTAAAAWAAMGAPRREAACRDQLAGLGSARS